jgi:hypothetical protein
MTEAEITRRYIGVGAYLNNQTDEGWADLIHFVRQELEQGVEPGGYYYSYDDSTGGSGSMGPFATPAARQADLEKWELDPNDMGTGPVRFKCYHVDAQGIPHVEAAWRAG